MYSHDTISVLNSHSARLHQLFDSYAVDGFITVNGWERLLQSADLEALGVNEHKMRLTAVWAVPAGPAAPASQQSALQFGNFCEVRPSNRANTETIIMAFTGLVPSGRYRIHPN